MLSTTPLVVSEIESSCNRQQVSNAKTMVLFLAIFGRVSVNAKKNPMPCRTIRLKLSNACSSTISCGIVDRKKFEIRSQDVEGSSRVIPQRRSGKPQLTIRSFRGYVRDTVLSGSAFVDID